MGVVVLRPESNRTRISNRRKGDTEVKRCSDLVYSFGLPLAEIHWRRDSVFRVIAETSAGILANAAHRSLRGNR